MGVNIDELYHDYLLICKMNASNRAKVGMLTHLFSQDPNRWRVVGITAEALKIFQQNNFKVKTGLQINRCHIHDRHIVYTRMMRKNFCDSTAWWNYYKQKDKTIFATSSENNKRDYSTIIPFSRNKIFFLSRGYRWIHNLKEQQFLQSLADKHIKISNYGG